MIYSYSKSAKYYDFMMGEPKGKVQLIQKLIKKHKLNAQTVLEIACGTGAILKLMENDYEVNGLDLSEDMLNIAKKKVRKGKFYHDDMTSFSLNKKFDVILCIYDSLNHLQKFEDWKKVFNNVAKHLNKDGLFIFDVNTLAKFNRLGNTSNDKIHEIGKDLIVDKTSTIGKNRIEFHTRIFENVKHNNYQLYEEKVVEVAFETERIKKSIKKSFQVISIIDHKRKKASNKSERLYFVCKLK